MSYLIDNRVKRAMNSNFYLVYFIRQASVFNFYVLGSGIYIYHIKVKRKSIQCNCEDFTNHKTLCKHICFVLFKLLKLYRKKIFGNYKYEYILRRDQPNLHTETTFFDTFKFPKLDWLLFKKYYKNIELKTSFFCSQYFKKFESYYSSYSHLLAKQIVYPKDENCTICMDKIDKGVFCLVCKKNYHIDCINTWLSSCIHKKCPLCRSDCWSTTFTYFNLLLDKKINKNDLKL